MLSFKREDAYYNTFRYGNSRIIHNCHKPGLMQTDARGILFIIDY